MLQNKISVDIRIKPSLENSIEISNNSLTIGTKKYQFNNIHYTTTQKQLFNKSVVPLLEKFINGYNSTILAYGQTGSGKTYTMGISPTDTSGIVPQALNYLFDKKLDINCTFIEIYNEEIIDLLSDHKHPLHLREMNGDIHIAGATEVELKNATEGLDVLRRGCLERTTKSTKMNSSSSRSHAIFTIYNKIEINGKIIISKCSFVDLAGSERLKKTMCIGERARESISINSGLLALGNVISALYKKSSHVPFRDSKLTRILQSCLKGYVLMIACISSSHSDMSETHNTLKYANRAASIETNVKMNIEIDNSKMTVILLKKEIQKLKNENQILKERLRQSKNVNVEELMRERRELKKQLDNLKYEKDVRDKSEDIAQEILKHPFVQNLIEENQKMKEELGKYKNTQIIEESGLKVSMNLQNTDELGKYSNDICKAINNISDINMDKEKDKNIKNVTIFESPLSEIERVCKEQEKFSKLNLENGLQSENTPEGILKNPEIENTLNSPNETKITWNTANKSRKRVTFDISPPKKKSSLWTPRKEKVLLDISLLNKVEGFIPHAMTMYKGSLVFSSADNKVRVWKDTVSELFSDNGVKCVYGSDALYYNTRMILKQYDERQGTRPVYAYKNEISCLNIIDNHIYTGHEDGTINCLDIRNMKLITSKIHASTVFCIEKHNNEIYSCSRDHTIKIHKPSPITLTPPHYDSVHGLIKYKGELVSFSRDNSIKRWRDEKIVKTVPSAHTSWIKCGVSLDDAFITGSKNGTLRFWDFCENSVFCVGSYKLNGAINCIIRHNDTIFAGSQNREIVQLRSTYKM